MKACEISSECRSVSVIGWGDRKKNAILLRKVCIYVDYLSIVVNNKGNSHQQHSEYHNDDWENKLKDETFPVTKDDSQSFEESGFEVDSKLRACPLFMGNFIEFSLKLLTGVWCKLAIVLMFMCMFLLELLPHSQKYLFQSCNTYTILQIF